MCDFYFDNGPCGVQVLFFESVTKIYLYVAAGISIQVLMIL